MAAHKFWRINMPAVGRSSSIAALAEVSMRITPGGANQCTGGTPRANYDSGASVDASKAVDNNTTTSWNSPNVTTTNYILWWQYTFASAIDIVEIALTASNIPSYTPTEFVISFSDDGINWTNFYQVTSSAWTASEVKVFSIIQNILAPKVLTEIKQTNFKFIALATPLVVGVKDIVMGRPSEYGTRPNFGLYKIQGSTTVLGLPTARTVKLYDQKSGLLVREAATKSDGAFSFLNLSEGAYSVVGVNPSGDQNSVIYAHVLSVPM